MSITKAFRLALALGLVSAPLALVGCDDAATPPAAGTPAAKPTEAPKAPETGKPAAPAPAPAEKK